MPASTVSRRSVKSVRLVRYKQNASQCASEKKTKQDDDHMDKTALIAAIRNSGGGQNALDEVDDLLARINYLDETPRYRLLLSQLAKANDKSNFLALVLEVNFAYQFESGRRELAYEVRQDANQKGSIDFMRRAPTGDNVFFELRLLQQTQSVTDEINEQLRTSGAYRLTKDGQFEQTEVARIQGVILSKTQNGDGKPIKFFSTAVGTVNVVVVDATAANLGMIDVHDCKLALYGDPSVPEFCRRQIFGLFQDDKPEYPQRIHDLASKFSHVKQTLHGVLFLFKEPHTGLISYRLEQYMMWNPALMNPAVIEEGRARDILADISAAIPWRRERD